MIDVINDTNRLDIQSQYVDHIVGSLDFIEVRSLLRNYIEYEKDKLGDGSLYAEILHKAPYLLEQNLDDAIEEMMYA
jgi:hypothetical protein